MSCRCVSDTSSCKSMASLRYLRALQERASLNISLLHGKAIDKDVREQIDISIPQSCSPSKTQILMEENGILRLKSGYYR